MSGLRASLSCMEQKDQIALLPHLELCAFTSKASVLWASWETSHFRAMIRGLLGGDTVLLWLNFSTMDWLRIWHTGGKGALTSLCSPQTHPLPTLWLSECASVKMGYQVKKHFNLARWCHTDSWWCVPMHQLKCLHKWVHRLEMLCSCKNDKARR